MFVFLLPLSSRSCSVLLLESHTLFDSLVSDFVASVKSTFAIQPAQPETAKDAPCSCNVERRFVLQQTHCDDTTTESPWFLFWFLVGFMGAGGEKQHTVGACSACTLVQPPPNICGVGDSLIVRLDVLFAQNIRTICVTL
jgi:hypothetical protein